MTKDLFEECSEISEKHIGSVAWTHSICVMTFSASYSLRIKTPSSTRRHRDSDQLTAEFSVEERHKPLGMETPADAAACSYDQVVFSDIPHCFSPGVPVTCRYSLGSGFQPGARDWVGIFKVGWSTIKDYHTFVWAEPCTDEEAQQSLSWQAVFKEYYLPKDEVEFYQFCYVDCGGQVRGASTPFCFKNPEEQSMEIMPDDDLLVITTQEQVEQNVREKAELMKELDQLKGQNETLRSDLQRQQQEVILLRGQNEEKNRVSMELTKERDQLKKQNQSLGRSLGVKQNENDQLKEEVMVQMTKQMELQAQSAAQTQPGQSASADGVARITEEKYERALTKVNQLKEDRQLLREKVEVLEEDISKLNSKLREAEREAIKMKDNIQLLQVDLQSSTKEKEEKQRLLAELRSLKDTIEMMKKTKKDESGPRQVTPRSSPDDKLKAQCQTLATRLQEAQAQLGEERELARNAQRRAESLEGEWQKARQHLEDIVISREQERRKSSKQDLQLREAHELIADKDGIIGDKEQVITLIHQEKDELDKENKSLKSEIEGLRKAYAELHEVVDLAHRQPDPADAASAGHDWTPQEAPRQSVDMYQNDGNCAEPLEELLVCRHCHESFPGITRDELEQHEQTHRVCPFCTIICDNMEQAVFEDHVYSHEM